MEKEKFELKDIVLKLVGSIDPVGEPNADEKRFENLKVMTGLVEDLLVEINGVAFSNRNRHEHSMKKAGQHADRFLALMSGEYKPDDCEDHFIQGDLVVVSHWGDFDFPEDAVCLGRLSKIEDSYYYISGNQRGFKHCKLVYREP